MALSSSIEEAPYAVHDVPSGRGGVVHNANCMEELLSHEGGELPTLIGDDATTLAHCLNRNIPPNNSNLSKATTNKSFEHKLAYSVNITTHKFHTPANFHKAMSHKGVKAADQEIASLALNRT